MTNTRRKIILDYAKWTALSALRSGSPVKSRKQIYSLLDAVTFRDVLETRRPITRSRFDEWHEAQTLKMRASNLAVPIGWRVKLINVYLKTAAYVGDLGRPGLREVLHPPIDAGLWKGFREKFRGQREILDEVCCVQRIKNITTYSTYLRIIEGCKMAASDLDCLLIEVEQLWEGSATPTLVTARAFEAARGCTFSSTNEFLKHFRDCGCYLEDLSHEPVDQLEMSKRNTCLRNEIDALSDRIKSLAPLTVVIVLKRIEPHVRAALEKAGCKAKVFVLPFPGLGHQTKYKTELAAIIRKHL